MARVCQPERGKSELRSGGHLDVYKYTYCFRLEPVRGSALERVLGLPICEIDSRTLGSPRPGRGRRGSVIPRTSDDGFMRFAIGSYLSMG
jgi:hypothetical protein